MNDKDTERIVLEELIYATSVKLAYEHNSAIGGLIAGLIDASIAEPKMVSRVANFILGEITAAKRVN